MIHEEPCDPPADPNEPIDPDSDHRFELRGPNAKATVLYACDHPSKILLKSITVHNILGHHIYKGSRGIVYYNTDVGKYFIIEMEAQTFFARLTKRKDGTHL